MFKTRWTSILLASVATVAICNQALSQEATSSEVKLQTLPVKGKTVRMKRDEKSTVADTPFATETTAKTISEKNITSISDLGNTVEPGVSYVANKRSVNIRGLEDDRVLTTLDGIPLPYLSVLTRSFSASGAGGNTFSGAGGVDTYDFSSLSRIDIVRGADLSQAGSGALGGAMVLQTLEPSDLLKDGKDLGGVAKSGFDSADNSFSNSAAVAQKINDTSILLQGGYKFGHETETKGNVDSYGSTRSVADPLNFYQRNVLLKVRQDIEGGHQIGFTAEHFGYNSSANLKSLQGAAYTKDGYEGISNKTRDRLSLDYRFDNDGEDGLIKNAFGTLYWQRTSLLEGYQGTRVSAPIGDYSRMSNNSENSFGFSGYAKGSFEMTGLNHDVTIGTNLSFSHFDQYTSGTTSCSITYVSSCAFYHLNQADTPQVDAYRTGVFAEDKIGFGDSGFSLTPGLRFDWYKYAPVDLAGYQANTGYTGLPNGQSGTTLSPKLRAAWQAREDVEIYGQFATAFKAPNVSQLYSNYTNPGLYQVTGNPNLKAETSYGFELGANLGDEEFGGHIAVFTNRYRNFIDYSVVSVAGLPLGSYQYFNRANVSMSGVEFAAHKKFNSGYNVHGSLSYVNGVDLSTKEVLASVPPIKGIVGIGYEKESWGADISLVAAGDVSKDSKATVKAKGYGVTNLTAWWAPEQAKGLRVQAGIYNLFDRQYYDALAVKDVSTSTAQAFYSAPGRTFKVSIAQTF